MSRIYFHSPTDEVEVRGSEQTHMGVLIGDLLVGVLRCAINQDLPSCPSVLRRVVPDGWWMTDFTNHLPLVCRTGSDGDRFYFIVEGKKYDPWVVGLNTALAIGADPLKLFARLHGQCEIHAYILGQHREWVAGIIDAGLASGLYRDNQGWQAAAGFLREDAIAPIVTSYSVCEQFPNAYVAGWEDDNDGDDWYKLSPEQRWEMAFAKLENRLEITPDWWGDFVFDDGLNAFQLLAKAVELSASEAVANPD